MMKTGYIFWDFDGVLMNSMEIRDSGFERVLSEYPDDQVAQLMEFHRENGGLSRYVKFRYFFEEIRGEEISEEEVREWAGKFSDIMRELLTDPGLLIRETIDFVITHSGALPMHIVSGSDQQELRYLCRELDIAGYFKSIHGSPTPKPELVRRVMDENGYEKESGLLIGDSINDFHAARDNGIRFLGYNNPSLKQTGDGYLEVIREDLILQQS